MLTERKSRRHAPTHGRLEVRRRAAVGLLAACLLLGLSPLAAAQQAPTDEAALYEAAKREGTVVWYFSSPLEPMLAVAQAFQKAYPGVKVETLRSVGVAQYQRVLQEIDAKRNVVDVMSNTDEPSMQALIDAGHVADWRVPTSDRFSSQYRRQNFAYSAAVTSLAIVYNVNRVTPEEAKLLENDWTSVVDPRFKNRLAATSMMCGSCYAGVQMFLDPALKDKFGEDFLRKVAAQNPAVYADPVVALDRVIAGEQDFTFWSWDGIAATKWQQGAPIRWVFPKPTPTLGLSWQGVSKYAPHPNAARLFQNWFLSEGGASALQQYYGTPTTIANFPDTRPVVKESWYRPVTDEYRVNFDLWATHFTRDMKTYIAILRAAR